MYQKLCHHASSSINNEGSSEIMSLIPERLPFSDAPRPCYYMLRLLGMWQPKNSGFFMRTYNYFTWVLWLVFVVAIFMLSYIHDKFSAGEVLNSIGSILDFCCPLLFLRYYFYYGNFEQLLSHVYPQSNEERWKETKTFRYVYSCISLTMWVAMTIFFVFHWLPFFSKTWQCIVYTVLLAFTMGWWATWLSLYGYVCHVHRNQIFIYKSYMEKKLSSSPQQVDDELERKHAGHLLLEFNELQLWLDQTQKHFSNIISFAVAYHILDIFVFTYAYWHGSFGEHYPIWQYAGTITYDTLSILIKLYPAALVSQALHNTVISAGDHCYPDDFPDVIPYHRFNFFQHLFLREQDMGFRILGVKITLKLTVAIFVTVATATLTFIRLTLPSDYEIGR